jgi:hypothetical protein
MRGFLFMANSIKNRIKIRESATHCYYCERDFKGLKVTVDHILPQCKGGTDVIENLVASCEFCNLSKAGYTLQEFISLLEVRKDYSSGFDRIPKERVFVVYNNVLKLLDRKLPPPRLPSFNSTLNLPKIPKLYRGEIATIPEVKPLPIDNISLKLKRERLKRVAELDCQFGYIYDERPRSDFHL